MATRQVTHQVTRQATRLATIPTDVPNTFISYWLLDGAVYRLSEYEPVCFDTCGLPLGARWECSKFHWDKFHTAVFS
jgi:hypothetical protein